jgi:hypothetical protein
MGFDNCQQRVQPASRRPALRTLFICGYTGGSIAHQGVLKPGVALLSKAFMPDALDHAVREVLEAEIPGGGPDR